MLCNATDLPVNADFEGGYADAPEGVYGNVLRAIDAGVSGLSIEDREGHALIGLRDAVDRLHAARNAIDESGQNVMLIGRSEGHFIGRGDLSETIERLAAYAEAGADCLFAPGVTDLSDIKLIIEAVHPKPVNVMITGPEPRVDELAAIGVRRVSVGGSLAAAAWRGFEYAAKMLASEGKLPPRQ
jgi:2-methylisocitrate lyase-like PEP mutase family enzyme